MDDAAEQDGQQADARAAQANRSLRTQEQQRAQRKQRKRQKQAAAAEGRAVDLSKVQNRTIYLAPEAGGFYTTAFGILQGMATDGGENNAPIRLELAYNMIK